MYTVSVTKPLGVSVRHGLTPGDREMRNWHSCDQEDGQYTHFLPVNRYIKKDLPGCNENVRGEVKSKDNTQYALGI